MTDYHSLMSSPDDWISNWRTPLPWHRKLRLAARNTARKIARRQGCCGHPGEPGC